MMRMRNTLAAALLLAVAACGSEPASTALPPLPTLRTLVVQAPAGGSGRTWDGLVEAVQQADLSAQTVGRVTVVNADVNDRVAAGDVLLRLTAVEQQAGASTARAQLRAAEAAASEADANYRRYAALGAGQYVSRAQIDQARASRDSAVAARDAARAQVAQAGQQAEYTVVRAPFAGIVSARRVEPGEAVAPGQPLMAMYAPGALRIEVQVPQSDAEAIRLANAAQVVLGDGRRVDAAEVVVFPAADPATHSVGVRVTLPDVAPAPSPGVTAKVVFPIRTSLQSTPVQSTSDQSVQGPIPSATGGAVQVPRSALVQRGEVSGVYVLADGRLSLRQVRLGQAQGDRVDVLAGLRRGETIAADPVAAVQALAAQRRAAGERSGAHD